MIRQLPIIPTIVVVAAAAVMVALGFWQLGRAEEKAELIALADAASRQSEQVEFPLGGDDEETWFRRSSVDCVDVAKVEAIAGTAASGAKGWAFRATCKATGTAYFVDLGFARSPGIPDWSGGEVSGTIAKGPRLVADPAVGELEPLAKPDPNDLPNNHLAYAGQWFFFALTALVIYGFAVRSRLRKRA